LNGLGLRSEDLDGLLILGTIAAGMIGTLLLTMNILFTYNYFGY
jgi:hypothetical protein